MEILGIGALILIAALICSSLPYSIIGWAAAGFLALIMVLAIPARYTKKYLTIIAIVTVVAALIMYGYGYGTLTGSDGDDISVLISILRTVLDSTRIFVGSENWEAIKGAYDIYPEAAFFFWMVQLLAMTTSASAVIISLGSGLLKRVRMWLLRMQDITLIFGLSENTLEFGRELAEKNKTAILYVDQSEQAQLYPAADQLGALIRSDPDALSGNVRFLKSIGLRKGKRKLHVYAMDRSMVANQQYARKLMESLEKRGISEEQTTLTLLSVSEETGKAMQANAERYGYGSVISINEPDMTARMLIRCYPPYQWLTFDKNARATSNFHGVIIGFGQTGQAVLRQLVMNSQFHGSTSRIAVFAPDFERRMGWLSHECREMLNHYNIPMFPHDGRSLQLYDYLAEHIHSVNYIAICAGSDVLNLEIGEQLQPFLEHRGCGAPILMCSRRGVSHLSSSDHIVSHRIYTPEILCSDQIDRMAMTVNQSYSSSGTAQENWKVCSYFDRVSSRAAADFHDALLHCAGVTREEALKQWNPQGELLENLAASEHKRWVAFHYCMGFRPMSEVEFQKRAADYLDQKAVNPESVKNRIRKDGLRRIHACLIPWDELDAYAKKENAITSENEDYAEKTRKSIIELVNILRAMEETP